MHTTLYEYIVTEMTTATDFVCRNMPVNVGAEQAYEDLLCNAEMATAFKNAVKYLQPSMLHKRVTVSLNNKLLTLNLRLPTTEKYPMYLMPFSTAMPTLAPESKLAQALSTPIRVATHWMALKKAFHYLNANDFEPEVMALLFPWIVGLVERWVDA